MKRFKFVGKEAANFGGLGNVEPGQEFDVHEEHYDLFEGTVLFKQIRKVKAVKKEEKAVEEDDCPGCPKAKKEE